MRRLAVFSKRLTVVRHDDDHGIPELVRSLEFRKQTSELLIDERDLCIVRPRPEPRQCLQRRVIRQVRIEVVHPREERGLSVRAVPRAEPAQDGVGDRAGRALVEIEHPRPIAVRRDLEVVPVETLVQPEPRVQNEAADERRGLVPVRPETLGQRRVLLAQTVDAVVENAVAGGRKPGQDGSVRWQGDRHACHRVGEQDAAAAERVDERGLGLIVAIASEPVGPDGVERHEQEVVSLRVPPADERAEVRTAGGAAGLAGTTEDDPPRNGEHDNDDDQSPTDPAQSAPPLGVKAEGDQPRRLNRMGTAYQTGTGMSRCMAGSKRQW